MESQTGGAFCKSQFSHNFVNLFFIIVAAAIGKELAALRSSGDIDVAKIAIRTTRPSQVPSVSTFQTTSKIFAQLTFTSSMTHPFHESTAIPQGSGIPAS